MKKIILSFLLVPFASVCEQESVPVSVNWEKAVQVGAELAQDSEVIEVVMKLHKAFLNFVEIILQKIASNCDAQEKAIALVGLDYLAEIAKDSVVRSVIEAGNIENLTDDEIRYLQEKTSPLVALMELYGPAIQQIIEEEFMITQKITESTEDGTTITRTVSVPDLENNILFKKGPLFLLDRVNEILNIARKQMK